MAINGPLKDLDGVLLSEDGSLPPLRATDLIKFLTERNRSTKCPHCQWKGGWEIAMQDEGDEDPRLQIFKTESQCGEKHTSTALVCPNCGHFAQVATYKIRQWMKNKERENE